MPDHDVIDDVIEHFATATVRGAEDWTPEQLGRANAFRETVLAIAAERAAAARRCETWIQVGVRFAEPRNVDSFLAGAWALAIERWIEEKRIRWCYFMRKPPGLRIRLGAEALDDSARAELEGLLKQEPIASLEYGLYEAEVHQFGGETGMSLAHDFFTYDTVAYLQLRRLARNGVEEDAEVLSLIVLGHLIAGICGDEWEQWDLWRNVALLAGRRFRADAPAAFVTKLERDYEENRELFEQLIRHPAEAIASFAEPVREIVSRYFASNVRLIEAFRDAVRRRKLLFGPRTILPFFIIFHWNRWDFSGIDQCFLTDSMQRFLDPKRTE